MNSTTLIILTCMLLLLSTMKTEINKKIPFTLTILIKDTNKIPMPKKNSTF